MSSVCTLVVWFLEMFTMDFQEPNNKYISTSSSASLLEQARALLRSSGSLTEAALMIEAAIQQGELGEGGYEAWIFLGETRSMDEREEAAMRALKEGVRRAEEVGAKGEGMLVRIIYFIQSSRKRSYRTHSSHWPYPIRMNHTPKPHIPFS